MTGESLSAIEIASLVEVTEAAAYADLLRAAPSSWGCVVEETAAGWCLFAPSSDLVLFNRIVGAGIVAPARREDLQPLVDRYRSAGLRSFGVQLSPAAQPAALAGWLADAGLLYRDRWTKVYRPADPVTPPPTDLRIAHIHPDRAELFAAVMTTGCRWFVTETGEDLPDRPNPSFRNMMRAGFHVAYHRPNFMP